MREHRSRAAAAAFVVAGVALALGSLVPASASGTVDDVGWWTRNPLASAPDGGFAVASAPDGPTTVAAIRIDVGAGLSNLVIGAPPASGAEVASVQVCVTGDAWSAESGGALADAPAAACEGEAVPFAEAGDAWRADVSSLVAGRQGAVSLALVPAGSLPFDATFEAPTVIRATPTASSSPTSSTPTTVAFVPPTANPAPGFSPAPVNDNFSVPAPTTPPATVATLPDATGAATTTVPTDDQPETVPFDIAAGIGLEDVETAGARWGEAGFLVLISALVGLSVFGVSRLNAARA